MPITRDVPKKIASVDGIELFDAGFRAGKGKSVSILIKRFRGLGDVLQLLPALKALKRKYGPNVKLIFGTSPVLFPLLRRFKFINHLIGEVQAENEERYELVIDLQGKVDFLPICKKAPRQELYARLLNLDARCYRLPFDFPVFKRREIENARAILRRAGWNGERLLGLHLMTFTSIRTWPVEKNLELVEKLSNRDGWKILILESHAVREQFRKFDHVIVPDRTGLIDLLGLLTFCDCLVCPDSGVMHLAGFLDIPSVALFGPIPPEFRIKYYPKTVGLSLNLDCQPCFDWQLHACYKRPNYRQCLKDITAEMVIKKLEEIGCF